MTCSARAPTPTLIAIDTTSDTLVDLGDGRLRATAGRWSAINPVSGPGALAYDPHDRDRWAVSWCSRRAAIRHRRRTAAPARSSKREIEFKSTSAPDTRTELLDLTTQRVPEQPHRTSTRTTRIVQLDTAYHVGPHDNDARGRPSPTRPTRSSTTARAPARRHGHYAADGGFDRLRASSPSPCRTGPSPCSDSNPFQLTSGFHRRGGPVPPAP